MQTLQIHYLKNFYKIFRAGVNRSEKHNIQRAFDYVTAFIDYPLEKQEFLKIDVKEDEIMPLVRFIELKQGLCGHQALLVGSLLERAKQDGVVKGVSRINGYSGIYIKDGKEKSFGHAWIRYENSEADHHNDISSSTIIIDPAQSIFGHMEGIPLVRILNRVPLREMYQNPRHDEKWLKFD